MEEKWNNVLGFENYYQVSNFGRVKSLERKIKDNIGRMQTIKEKILKPGPSNKYDHLYVILCKNRKRVMRYIHRLVLEAFDRPCPKGLECRHLDGDSQNNHISNLKWGTHKENMQDRIVHNTSNRGEKSGVSKLNNLQVRIIKKYFKLDNSYGAAKFLTEVFKVHKTSISLIKNKKRWYYVN